MPRCAEAETGGAGRCDNGGMVAIETLLVDCLVAMGVLASAAALVWGLARLARRMRRRGGIGSPVAAAMAAFDEGYHSTAHDTYVEMRARDERPQQAPSPQKSK